MRVVYRVPVILTEPMIINPMNLHTTVIEMRDRIDIEETTEAETEVEMIRETIDCEMTAEIGSQEMTAGTDNVGMITERDATETAAETDLIEKVAMVDTTIRIIEGTSDMTNHQSIETQTRTISLRNQDIRSRDTMIAMMRSTILRDKIHSIDTMTGGTHQSIRNLPANQQRREEGYTFTEAGERKQETSHL